MELTPNLPTLPDGRFAPGGFRLSVNIVKTMQVGMPMAISDDGERVAVERQVGRRIEIMPADEPIPAVPATEPAGDPRDSIIDIRDPRARMAVFSPDGRRFACVKSLGRERAVVVVDHKQGPEYLRIQELTFSPDGKRLAYIATLPDHRQAVVVDGEAGKSYGSICGEYRNRHAADGRTVLGGRIVFSPDSQRIAYAAFPVRPNTDMNDKSPTVLVVDGVEQLLQHRGDVDDILWSPDSRHVVCVAKVNPSAGWMSPVVLYVDGKPAGKECGGIPGEGIRYSPDGQRLAYIARDRQDGPYYVVEGGQEGKAYTHIDSTSLRFDSQGRIEFDARPTGENKAVHVCGGSETDGARSQLRYSADGKHAVWTTGAGDRFNRGSAIVFDGGPGTKSYERIEHLQLSPDGAHYACVVSNQFGSSVLVIDGLEQKFPLRGNFIRVRYAAADTLRVVTADGGEWRVADVKLVPIPPAETPKAPAHLAKGSDKAEALIAQLRKTAEVADEEHRRFILWQVPIVYARHGDKAAALDSLALLESQDARSAVAADDGGGFPSTQPTTRRMRIRPPIDRAGGSSMIGLPDGPENRLPRRLYLMRLIIDGQVKAGNKVGAAATADELFADTRKIENIQLRENERYLELAASAFVGAGKPEKVDDVLKVANSSTPDMRARLLSDGAAFVASTGDAATAMKLAAAVDVALYQSGVFFRVGMALEEAGKRPEAAAAYAKALAVGGQEQFERGNVTSTLAALVRTGGVEAIKQWSDGAAADRKWYALQEVLRTLVTTGGDDAAALAVLDMLAQGHPTPSYVHQVCTQVVGHRPRNGPSSSALDRRLLSVAATAGAASTPPAPISSFQNIARMQKEAGDTDGVAATAVLAAQAYQRHWSKQDLRMSDTASLAAIALAELQVQAADKKGAVMTLKAAVSAIKSNADQVRANPDDQLGKLVRMTELMVQAGDAAAASQIARDISDLVAPIADGVRRPRAMRQFGAAQLASGDLKAAAQTLADCGAGADLLIRLGIAQETAGDKAAAEQSFQKAVASPTDQGDPYHRRSNTWCAVAAARATAGDLPGAIAALDREKDKPPLGEHAAIVAEALVKKGDIAGAGDVLLRIGQGTGYQYVNALDQAIRAANAAGNHKGAMQLAAQPGPKQSRPAQAEVAILAAVAAGELDVALDALKEPRIDLLFRMAQSRLDAKDDAGTKKILIRGLEMYAAQGLNPGVSANIEHLANLMLDVGYVDEAMAALDLVRPSGTPAATQPGTRPATQVAATRPADSPYRGFRRDDPFVDRGAFVPGLACVGGLIRAGRLDAVLAWAANLGEPGRSSVALAAADALMSTLDPPQRPSRRTRPDPMGSRSEDRPRLIRTN